MTNSFLLHELARTKDSLTREKRRTRSLRRSRQALRQEVRTLRKASRDHTDVLRASGGHCGWCGRDGCGAHDDLDGLVS